MLGRTFVSDLRMHHDNAIFFGMTARTMHRFLRQLRPFIQLFHILSLTPTPLFRTIVTIMHPVVAFVNGAITIMAASLCPWRG